MARTSARPLSPHLTIWRWGPHMLVSILHRATGSALAVAGGIGLVWWLTALARGPEAYGTFVNWVFSAEAGDAGQALVNVLARIVAIGLTWAFLQHLFSGLRHLVLDTGAGYELRTNKTWAMATIAGSVILTVVIWGYVLGVRG